jgi:hypothetical protein
LTLTKISNGLNIPLSNLFKEWKRCVNIYNES